MDYVSLPGDVRVTPVQAIFGEFESCFAEFSGTNDASALADIWTSAVAGTAASQAYVGPQIVDDVSGNVLFSFTHTVGSTDTTAILQATSIVAAWNASDAYTYFIASNVAGSSATITFTGQKLGRLLTIQESDANLGTPVRTQTAGSPANIFPGRLVVRSDTAAKARPSLKHPVNADFTAQVMTFTWGSVGAADIVQVSINYRGEVLTDSVLYAASQTATLAALAVSLNALIDTRWGAGFSLDVTSDATTLVITAEEAGDEFDASALVLGAGAGTVAQALTVPASVTTSLRRRMKGVPKWHTALRARQASGDIDDLRPVYRGYMPVTCGTKGIVFVESAQAISPGDDVYVGVDTTAPGKFYNAAAADRIWLPRDMLTWNADENTDNGTGGARLSLNNL